MENNTYLDDRFKTVMELNEILEEITNINKQLKPIICENISLRNQNTSMQNVLLEKENIFNVLTSKNEILEKESMKIEQNIDKLKKALI